MGGSVRGSVHLGQHSPPTALMMVVKPPTRLHLYLGEKGAYKPVLWR